MILFIKTAQAGTGTASDVNYLILLIILFLLLLLGLVYLQKAIVSFVRHHKNEDDVLKQEEGEAENFENGNV